MTVTTPLLRRLAAVGLLGILVSAEAGYAEGIRGTYDPVTRTFTPSPPRVEKKAASQLTRITGTFKITVRVNIHRQIPADVAIGANVLVTAQDPPTSNPALQYQSNLYGQLTRSGNLGTVKLTFHFDYEVADPTAPVTFELSLFEVGKTTTEFAPANSHIVTVPMPQDGTTTPVTLEDTI